MDIYHKFMFKAIIYNAIMSFDYEINFISFYRNFPLILLF